MRLGGYDYLCKPVEREVLLHLARGAVRHHHLAREAERAQRNLEAVFRSVADALISVDPRMLVTDLNPAAEGFCLFSRAAIGQPFGEPPAGRSLRGGVPPEVGWGGAGGHDHRAAGGTLQIRMPRKKRGLHPESRPLD